MHKNDVDSLRIHVHSIDKVLFNSNLNKSFMNILNSDKLERLFGGITRMMWFQSLTNDDTVEI